MLYEDFTNWSDCQIGEPAVTYYDSEFFGENVPKMSLVYANSTVMDVKIHDDNGDKYAEILPSKNMKGDYWQLKLPQMGNLTKAGKYTAVIEAKVPTTSGIKTAELSYSDAVAAFVGTRAMNLTVGSEWKAFTNQLTLPSDGTPENIRVLFFNADGWGIDNGENTPESLAVYIDNISLYYNGNESHAPVPEYNTEAVVNSDKFGRNVYYENFEGYYDGETLDGAVVDWFDSTFFSTSPTVEKKDSFVGITAKEVDGNMVAEVKITGETTQREYYWAKLCNNINFSKNGIYTTVMDVMQPQGSVINNLDWSFATSSGAPADFRGRNMTLTFSNAWKTLSNSYHYDKAKDTERTEIAAIFSKGGSWASNAPAASTAQFTVYVDNISMYYANDLTVTFDANGGTAASVGSSVNTNSITGVNLRYYKPTHTDLYKDFIGWQKPDGTVIPVGDANFLSYKFTEDITLKAVWADRLRGSNLDLSKYGTLVFHSSLNNVQIADNGYTVTTVRAPWQGTSNWFSGIEDAVVYWNAEHFGSGTNAAFTSASAANNIKYSVVSESTAEKYVQLSSTGVGTSCANPEFELSSTGEETIPDGYYVAVIDINIPSASTGVVSVAGVEADKIEKDTWYSIATKPMYVNFQATFNFDIKFDGNQTNENLDKYKVNFDNIALYYVGASVTEPQITSQTIRFESANKKFGIRNLAEVDGIAFENATEVGFIATLSSLIGTYDLTHESLSGTNKLVEGKCKAANKNAVIWGFSAENMIVSAVLTGISQENYSTEFVIRPFVVVDGQYFYGEIKTINAKTAAQNTLDAQPDLLDEDQKNLLNSIIETNA